MVDSVSTRSRWHLNCVKEHVQSIAEYIYTLQSKYTRTYCYASLRYMLYDMLVPLSCQIIFSLSHVSYSIYLPLLNKP